MVSKIKQIRISENEFSPVVLKSSLFAQGKDFPADYRLEERNVYDYEIEFFTFSTGSMLIDDKLYPIQKGDIVLRRPGQTTQGIMPYVCYLVCFDLLGETGKSPVNYDFNEPQEFQNYYLNSILDAVPKVFHTSHPEKFQYLFDSILKEFINPFEGSGLLQKSYLLQILYQLYKDISNPLTNINVPISPHYIPIKRTIAYIEENYQSRINLNELSTLAGYSPSHFHKAFSGTMGITPNEFLNRVRLVKAKELLVKTGIPISEIALQCGFQNIPYFSFLFKRQLNISPREFRERYSYL